MKGTPYSIRNNEFYGDMAAWLRANAQDNDGELLRLKRNLRLARQEALTARQGLETAGSGRAAAAAAADEC